MCSKGVMWGRSDLWGRVGGTGGEGGVCRAFLVSRGVGGSGGLVGSAEGLVPGVFLVP